MNRIKELFAQINKIAYINKYTVTIFIFLIWITIFDANSILKQDKSRRMKREIERDIEMYKKNMERDKALLESLEESKESLEKFAREKYFMKKRGEDIFFIKE